MLDPKQCVLFSGGAAGAEQFFGAQAEAWGIEELVVGEIQEDKTVKGGTGWGAEFAKLCNKPLLVFDQKKDAWFRWINDEWVKKDDPIIKHSRFTATGTRFLEANGRRAIVELYARSFNR